MLQPDRTGPKPPHAAHECRKNSCIVVEAAYCRHGNHDVLTGLPSRRVFPERLGEVISRGRRHAEVMALLLLDLAQGYLIAKPEPACNALRQAA